MLTTYEVRYSLVAVFSKLTEKRLASYAGVFSDDTIRTPV